MVKRFSFVLMITLFEFTLGMVLVCICISLIELMAIAVSKPYSNPYLNKIAAFNVAFAYLFLVVIQIFIQKQTSDFTEEDLEIDE